MPCLQLLSRKKGICFARLWYNSDTVQEYAVSSYAHACKNCGLQAHPDAVVPKTGDDIPWTAGILPVPTQDSTDATQSQVCITPEACMTAGNWFKFTKYNFDIVNRVKRCSICRVKYKRMTGIHVDHDLHWYVAANGHGCC